MLKRKLSEYMQYFEIGREKQLEVNRQADAPPPPVPTTLRDRYGEDYARGVRKQEEVNDGQV